MREARHEDMSIVAEKVCARGDGGATTNPSTPRKGWEGERAFHGCPRKAWVRVRVCVGRRVCGKGIVSLARAA